MEDEVLESPIPDVSLPRCSYRGCAVTGAELMLCAASGCEKMIHFMCYQGILLKKHSDMQPLPPGKACCTKKCYAKAMKESSGCGDDPDGGNRKGNWDCDGKGGPDDPKTSLQILIDWWTTEGNYNQFCGKHNNGIKKKQFCARLAQKMSNETNSIREAKNVMNKIQHIEKQFKEAHSFATSETGSGIKENDEGTFKDAVRKKCPYYFDIIDVMSDRASSKPKATSYNIEFGDDAISGFSASDISEGEAEKTVASNMTLETTGTTSISKKTRPNSSKKGSTIDIDTLAMLSKASHASEERIKEQVRHNAFLEKLEQQKLELEQKKEERATNSWKGKSEELDYKMKLIHQYNDLKNTYHWTDEQIVSFYPDMKQIVDAQRKSDN
jgi:hypothetical protein